MSSATSPISTDSPSDPAGNPNPANFPSSTNYFYGFLIAFLCFLICFGALHVMARRRRAILIRDFLLYGDDDSGGAKITQKEPSMWQPTYVEARAARWADIMPLSTTLVQHDVLIDEKPFSPRPRNPLVAYLGGITSKQQPGSVISQVTMGMNIAVMINMPCAPGRRKEGEDEDDDIPEYQIGTVRVPWTDERLPPQAV
ncbi:hypothetical protein B0H15DRAFT_810054 [Mycena belliarum]|uniref:Uncharacterized protein n=1 Tax=Mycena belliarum TaxID=1033014 RepID=A0AAD6Y2G7_9AGAR|nr:hypothetical protein B0H15DRAFT_810054 [Mycena belliae]